MRKLIFLSLMTALMFSACNSSGDSDVRAQARESLTEKPAAKPSNAQGVMASQSDDNLIGSVTSIQFENKKFNFGTATSGDKVNASFKFTNTGKEPLIISDVKTSCGCTASDYPKEPLAPGDSAEIKAVFDTGGKSGNQTKNVTVMTNTDPATNVLIIEGNVERKS